MTAGAAGAPAAGARAIAGTSLLPAAAAVQREAGTAALWGGEPNTYAGWALVCGQGHPAVAKVSVCPCTHKLGAFASSPVTTMHPTQYGGRARV